MKFTLGFETPIGHPQPYIEVTGDPAFLIGYLQSVTPTFLLTTVRVTD